MDLLWTSKLQESDVYAPHPPTTTVRCLVIVGLPESHTTLPQQLP